MKQLVTCTLLLVTLHSYAGAIDDISIDDIYDMSIDELLQIRITGATLTKESIKTVPASASIYTHKEIARLGIDSLNDLMNLMPGFQSYRTSDAPVQYPFSVRGRRIGTAAAEVLVLMDGQRYMEPASNGSGRIFPKIPLDNIERVEFIRGPGSAIYGANAMLAVINIITKKEHKVVGIGYGSHDKKLATTRLHGSLAGVDVHFSGRIEDDNGDDYKLLDAQEGGYTDSNDPMSYYNFHLV
jgi:outer membrane cobalamin receptor